MIVNYLAGFSPLGAAPGVVAEAGTKNVKPVNTWRNTASEFASLESSITTKAAVALEAN